MDWPLTDIDNSGAPQSAVARAGPSASTPPNPSRKAIFFVNSIMESASPQISSSLIIPFSNASIVTEKQCPSSIVSRPYSLQRSIIYEIASASLNKQFEPNDQADSNSM